MITIYGSDGMAKTQVPCDDNSTQEMELQGDNALSLSFTLYEHVALEVNDYAEFMGRKYWLMERYHPEQVSTVEWKYDIKLYGIESLVKRFLVINDTDGDDEPVFTLTAPPRDHVALIVKSINNGMGSGDWKVGTVEGADNIVIDYFGKYCDEALKEVAEKVGHRAEWWVEGQTVNICRCEQGEEVTLGYGKGLLSLSGDMADNAKFYTRLYPVGSSRNIDPEKYGHTRLQLPGGVKHVDVNVDKYGVWHHYEAEAFAGIYPKRIGTVSSVRKEETEDEEGNPFTIWYFKDESLDFDPNDYELARQVKRVSFQEGSELAGLGEEADGTYYFEVNYDSETREFEIITIWPYDDDTQLPNDTLSPQAGDKYILWNIRMPDEYYPLAEQEFKEAVDQYNEENAIDVSRYKAPTDHVYIEEHAIDLYVGRRVRLESNKYFPDTGFRSSRITKITRKVNLPSQVDLEISDATSTGAMTTINDNITAVENYVREAMSGSFPDLIRSWDNTLPTDNNVFSARRVLKESLSRLRPDAAQGKITFAKGLDIGVYSSLVSGGTFRTDEQGNTYIEADNIFIRKKATIQETQVNRVTHISGEYIVSSASFAHLFRVEEFESYYRCYADDGEIDSENDFIVGDMAICRAVDRTEALKPRYYWRKVVGVGDNYVDLSKTDADTGSDIPVAGDALIQLGYDPVVGGTEEPGRQNAVIISSVAVDAPSIKLLQGIDSYTLQGKDIIGQGVDKTTARAFLKVLGDFAVGVPEQNTYLVYDSVNKVLRIKGKFITEHYDDLDKALEEREYLKEAFRNDTAIDGGVIATSLVQLGYRTPEGEYVVMSGVSGLDRGAGSISYWAGGEPVDRFTYDEESGKYVEKEGLAGNEATALIRMDGTGYLAAGNIRWDKKGKIDTNLGAFYFGDKLIDAYLNIFQLNEDSESGKLLDVTPLVPMTDIDVNHSVTIGGATLVWDAANKAIKVYDSKNGEPISLYTTGSLSALGLGSLEGGGGGGGGLIKLVHGFDDLGGAFDNTTMTDTFNAYTINEIWKLANAGASTIGTGNVVTAVSKTALGIVVTKGITLYDWARQPNKPTYSLSEINNVSGTYTGLTVGKAQTADRLSAARTIWGQSFDGSNNVTGALSGVTTITASSTIKGYRLQSTCATGTAPLLISSTTKVGNLNADLLDSYHESAFRMGYGHDGVKYRHAAYGDGNLQWRKIVTYVNTSGGIWQGCAVIGNLWLELGNTSAQEVVEIPFQAIFTAYYGDSAVYQNKSELYLPGYCVWDVIRIVRYGNNSWEVQVRVPVANYRLSFEYTVKNINNGGTVTAGQFSTSVKTSTVANDHDTNVTRLNSDKAYRLAKTVYLWGQPFDGTGNVSGALTGVTNIEASGYVYAPELFAEGYLYVGGTIETDGDISAVGNISAQGSVTALTTSDRRLKRDFDYTRSYTDRLLAMGRVCDFRYTEKARKRDKGGVDGEAHTGLLYQKVKEVLPSMAYETEDGYGALNYLSPDYINTIAGATQETARLVKALMEDIERLKKELSELKEKGGK